MLFVRGVSLCSRLAPAILVGDLISTTMAGQPVGEILTGGIADTLEAVVGALLLRRTPCASCAGARPLS